MDPWEDKVPGPVPTVQGCDQQGDLLCKCPCARLWQLESPCAWPFPRPRKLSLRRWNTQVPASTGGYARSG